MKQRVRQFVTSVFASCGVNFEDPTKSGIATAIDQCGSNAEAIMGRAGADVIGHHYAEVARLVQRLPG